MLTKAVQMRGCHYDKRTQTMHSFKTVSILNCARCGRIWIKPKGPQNKSFTDGNIGFLLMSGSSSTSLSQSRGLVIVKGWKVAALKTPK